jgi:hypothetical protein
VKVTITHLVSTPREVARRASFDHERGAASEVKLASARSVPAQQPFVELHYGAEDARGKIDDCCMLKVYLEI